MQRINAILLAVVLVSALFLVHTHNQNRVYFSRLQNLHNEYEELTRQISNRKVEVSKLTRTEDVRRKALREGLYAPTADQVRFIRINHAHPQ